jgi:hypothetical protein
MGYVKISDPNIIDLNALHNIINVVNQHSDTLNTLTNNFGATNNTTSNYVATDSQHLFDPASQMIVYGRASFQASDGSTQSATSTAPAGHIYYKTVTFSATGNGIPSFATTSPSVFLTTNYGNTTPGSVSSTMPDVIADAYNISATSFTIRLWSSQAISTNKIYVNWMVMGPKGK